MNELKGRIPKLLEFQLVRPRDGSKAIGLYMETPRLVIKSIENSDADDYHNHLFSNANVMHNLRGSRPMTKGESRLFVNASVQKYQKGSPFSTMSVFLKDGSGKGVFIGAVSLLSGRDHGVAEIEGLFNDKYWGKKYATEAVNAVIHHLVPVLQAHDFKIGGIDPVNLIVARVDMNNTASQNLILGAGAEVAGQGGNAIFYRVKIERGAVGNWESFIDADRVFGKNSNERI